MDNQQEHKLITLIDKLNTDLAIAKQTINRQYNIITDDKKTIEKLQNKYNDLNNSYSSDVVSKLEKIDNNYKIKLQNNEFIIQDLKNTIIKLNKSNNSLKYSNELIYNSLFATFIFIFTYVFAYLYFN